MLLRDDPSREAAGVHTEGRREMRLSKGDDAGIRLSENTVRYRWWGEYVGRQKIEIARSSVQGPGVFLGWRIVRLREETNEEKLSRF